MKTHSRISRWLEFQKQCAAKGRPITYLAVCPNSEAVFKAALRVAQNVGAPLIFAATLNQVDLEDSYTGWTPTQFCSLIKRESRKIGFTQPLLVQLDHGGPWCKDIQRQWPFRKTMNAVKDSMTECIKAGYDLIHVDCTINKDDAITPETVVKRTIELIGHCEKTRRLIDRGPIGYEVGTEEIGGKRVNIEFVDKFLRLLKIELNRVQLDYAWPSFVVALVGKDLHTSRFNSRDARKISKLLASYSSGLKVHFTDDVENPEDYPRSHVSAANVGPEFTKTEFQTLIKLEQKERSLIKRGALSGITNILKEEVIATGRWKKWLLPSETDHFPLLSPRRQRWLVMTGARYIWTQPRVLAARKKLQDNLSAHGIDTEETIIRAIGKNIAKYLKAFNLVNIGPLLARSEERPFM